MNTIQNITSDLLYVGASEGRHALFENIYPVPNGMSYNAYVLLDDKTVLMDTCDTSVRELFLTNLHDALGGRPLDYIFIHHMEPDHAALLREVLELYPTAQIICTAKTQALFQQFFGQDISTRSTAVKDGDTLSTGRHTFSFYTAPMVHWPEVMVSYDQADKILFSADAFGTFGELNGNLFSDGLNLPTFLPEARRYYTNIVGKYGNQVQALLKKAGTLDIQQICPLHGPIWNRHIEWILDKYQKWSTYTPEDRSVLIIYGSIYGHTENAARVLAAELADRQIDVTLYDAAKTHPSVLVSEAFRCSYIVVACATYNNGIFPPVETALLDLKAHNFQNRPFALIQNGSWAPASGKLITALLSDLKGVTVDSEPITLLSALKPEQRADISALADRIKASL